MRRNVLITGSAILLGSSLASLRLASTADTVFYAAHRTEDPTREQFNTLVEQAVRRIALKEDAKGDEAEPTASRLRWLHLDLDGENPSPDDSPSGLKFDEVWCLTGGSHRGRRKRARIDARRTRRLLSILPKLGATEFNYVGTACHADGNRRQIAEQACRLPHAASDDFAEPSCALEREVVERCGAWGIGYRIFRTSWVVGETVHLHGAEHEGFLQFLAALHSLKWEVEERLPEYFEYHALRCRAAAGASLNLIGVDKAADLMLRIARRPDTSGHYYHAVAPENIPFTDLCERVGTAYDLSLLAVEDDGELNAIDRLFQARVDGLDAALASPQEFACGDTYRAADLAHGSIRLDDALPLSFLQAIRRGQDTARAGRQESVARMPASLEQKTIQRGDFTLTYHAGGSGETPIVLLNAFGQGLHYWYRLMDELMRRHRVIIWELRGADDSPQPFRLDDQVDDLEAILEQESVGKCYLVAWCTGPKVAVDFYLRRADAVSAMVFLNGSFKCAGSPDDLDTDYERNMEPLCRALDRRPVMAASVLNSLRATMTDNGLDMLDETDPEQLAASILSTMNAHLRPHVLAPFRSENVLLNYSRQLLDFWSRDTKAEAGRVRVPVLFVASEYDKIATPAMSREAARHFPYARYVEVQGATHYCLYDRPDLIAELIESFIRDPDEPLDGDGEVRAAAHATAAVEDAAAVGSTVGRGD